ncbi:hypothetical protein EON66_00970 [archaeon]|nr:MAG: hypothetical protein EON66_00970 [archaeon]
MNTEVGVKREWGPASPSSSVSTSGKRARTEDTVVRLPAVQVLPRYAARAEELPPVQSAEAVGMRALYEDASGVNPREADAAAVSPCEHGARTTLTSCCCPSNSGVSGGAGACSGPAHGSRFRAEASATAAAASEPGVLDAACTRRARRADVRSLSGASHTDANERASRSGAAEEPIESDDDAGSSDDASGGGTLLPRVRMSPELVGEIRAFLTAPRVHDIKQVAQRLALSKRIIVVTGAGVSVACGVPDFRSPSTGLYDIIRRSQHPALRSVSEPQELFDFLTFKDNPSLFYSVAHLLFSHADEAQPSLTHRFIAMLEQHGSLLRNYTQNIDSLESVAGASRVVRCHGSLAQAACLKCSKVVPTTSILPSIRAGEVPRCTATRCKDHPLGVFKPRVVFFRENLPTSYDKFVEQDRSVADFFLVIGSSLRVRPVSHMRDVLPPAIPTVLINKESLPDRYFDVELLGECDVVCRFLWNLLHRMAGAPLPPASVHDATGAPLQASITCVDDIMVTEVGRGKYRFSSTQVAANAKLEATVQRLMTHLGGTHAPEATAT